MGFWSGFKVRHFFEEEMGWETLLSIRRLTFDEGLFSDGHLVGLGLGDQKVIWGGIAFERHLVGLCLEFQKDIWERIIFGRHLPNTSHMKGVEIGDQL